MSILKSPPNKSLCLETERLILRSWCEDDISPYAKIAADPEVMRYFPKTLSHFESCAKVDKMQSLICERGWGFWAVEHRASGEFIGLTGLHEPDENLPCAPCVEVGWQFAQSAWGKGFATEAASGALNFAFSELDLDRVFSITARLNSRSLAVMERLGMQDTGADFDHPKISELSPLRPHRLYAIDRGSWIKHRKSATF